MSIFPDLLKVGNITLLPIKNIEQIFEEVTYKRTYDFLVKKKPTRECMISWFQPNYSTNHAVIRASQITIVISQHFIDHKLLKIDEIIKLHQMKIIFEFKQYILPSNIQKLFSSNTSIYTL